MARENPKNNVSKGADVAKGAVAKHKRARIVEQKRKRPGKKTQRIKRKDDKKLADLFAGQSVFIQPGQNKKQRKTQRVRRKNAKRKGQKRKTQNVKM